MTFPTQSLVRGWHPVLLPLLTLSVLLPVMPVARQAWAHGQRQKSREPYLVSFGKPRVDVFVAGRWRAAPSVPGTAVAPVLKRVPVIRQREHVRVTSSLRIRDRPAGFLGPASLDLYRYTLHGALLPNGLVLRVPAQEHRTGARTARYSATVRIPSRMQPATYLVLLHATVDTYPVSAQFFMTVKTGKGA